MSYSKEINKTGIRQLQITHVELKLYSDACFEPTVPVETKSIVVMNIATQAHDHSDNWKCNTRHACHSPKCVFSGGWKVKIPCQ